MYAYFIGKITYTDTEQIILENNGIGYNIKMPLSDIMKLSPGDEVKIYTYTAVREDAFLLYGFLTNEELNFFKLLLTVNGVGPKAALGILSKSSPSDIKVSILAQDEKSLSKVPGIGAKTAARIITELKGKIKSDDLLEEIVTTDNKATNNNSSLNSIKKEALDIVCALGMNATEAMKVINTLPCDENTKPEDLAFSALKLL